MKKITKKTQRKIRSARVRAKVKGTADRPRVSVFRSNNHISAQLIDDQGAKTICSVADMEIREKKTKKIATMLERAQITGELLAKKALEKGVTAAVFDRSGFKYHGAVKALAEGARKGGLSF